MRSIEARLERLENESASKQDLVTYKFRYGDSEDETIQRQKAINAFTEEHGRRPGLNTLYVGIRLFGLERDTNDCEIES